MIHEKFMPLCNHHPNLDKIDITPESSLMAHYIQSFPLLLTQILDIHLLFLHRSVPFPDFHLMKSQNMLSFLSNFFHLT